MDMPHDLPGKGRGDSRMNSISCAYGVPFNTCPGEYTYVNTDSSGLASIYSRRKIFARDIFKEFPNSFCEDVSFILFLCILLTKS